jgi:hypothetical protein
LTLVLVAFRREITFSPFAFPVFFAVLKFAYIDAIAFPFVRALAVRLALKILTCINVPHGKDVATLAMLQTVYPFTLVSVSILPLVDAEPISFGLLPRSNVRVTKNASPDPLSFFQARNPLSLVNFAIDPSVNTFAMGLICLKFAFISIPIAVPFHTSTASGIVYPVAFVQPCFAIEYNSGAFPLVINDLSSINTVFVHFDPKFFALLYLFVVENTTLHGIFFADRLGFPLLLTNWYYCRHNSGYPHCIFF